MRKPKPAKKSTPVKPARSLATFRAAHDVSVKIPAKIRATLEALRRDHGDQAYAYESTNPPGEDGIPPFIKLAGTSSAVIAPYRLQFIAHIVKIKQDTGSRRSSRLVWFATTAAALKARGGPAQPSDLE